MMQAETAPPDPPVAWAVAYAERGLAVFPVYSVNGVGRCSCGRKDCASPAKHPATPHGVKDATTDPDKIQQRWAGSGYNVGIATGNGLLVLDVDGPEGLLRRRHQVGDLRGLGDVGAMMDRAHAMVGLELAPPPLALPVPSATVCACCPASTFAGTAAMSSLLRASTAQAPNTSGLSRRGIRRLPMLQNGYSIS